MKIERTELLQGTLDMLILKALSIREMHGWSISQRIEQVSGKTFQIKQGSLYPALHRLEAKGSIESFWGISENKRRAKFYRLSRSGVKQLKEEENNWSVFAAAVGAVLSMD